MIRLYIFPMVAFNPYYDPSPPYWEVLNHIIYSLWTSLNCQKVYIPIAVRSLLIYETVLVVTPCLP